MKKGKEDNKLKYLILTLILINFLFVVDARDTVIDLRDWVKVQIVSPLSTNGNLEVEIEDKITFPIVTYMNRVLGESNLTQNFMTGSYNITLDDATNISIGNYIGVFNLKYNRVYIGNVLDIDGNVVILDTPSDFNFTIGNVLKYGEKDLNVDGSGEPIIFSLRADPNLNYEVDVTRLILHITDNSPMDDSLFGGINELDRGVVLRRKDGIYQNIFNIKSNGEIGELSFDKTYDDKAPAGLYGLTSRLTFAGQHEFGVAIRLSPNDDLQVIIQDDLTGLESFRIMVEGHLVN